MTLRRRPMMPGDISECMEIIAKHPVLGPRYGSRIAQMGKAWLLLLGCAAVQAAIAQTGDGPGAPICFFGASVFVDDEFLREIKTPPLRWLAPELAQRVLRGDSPVLTGRQIREANSGLGLNLVAWEARTHPEFERHSEIHRLALSRLIEDHLGFLLKEVIGTQVESAERLLWAMKAGTLLWDIRSLRYVERLEKDAEEIVREPHIIGVTRQIELARPGSWAGALFDYQPPRCGFSRSEQRMLLMALEGATDQELSRKFG